MKIVELFDRLTESDDQSALDSQVYANLQNEMTKQAKDQSKEWPNSLALVHDAYEVAGVERPTPAMRAAWTQYEELIVMAVQLLNKYHPDGKWRVTTSSSKL